MADPLQAKIEQAVRLGDTSAVVECVRQELAAYIRAGGLTLRSEERRVGKECRL